MLHTLVTAIQVAEIMDATLEDAGQFTVFAPNLAALKKLSKDEILNLMMDKEYLQKILLRNVVPSKIHEEDIVAEVPTKLQTIGKEKVTLQKKGEHILVVTPSGSGTIVTTDSFGENGIVHVVDSII